MNIRKTEFHYLVMVVLVAVVVLQFFQARAYQAKATYNFYQLKLAGQQATMMQQAYDRLDDKNIELELNHRVGLEEEK